MGRNRLEFARYRKLADRFGIPEEEVKRIVTSFFDVILADAGALPFNTPRKIYSKQKFDELSKVTHIPFIGRLGPVYSRYCKWRENESAGLSQRPRSDYRRRITQSDIEDTAAALLSGQAPPELKKKCGSEMFNRVWLVGQDGKKSARQVIPKKNDDGSF